MADDVGKNSKLFAKGSRVKCLPGRSFPCPYRLARWAVSMILPKIVPLPRRTTLRWTGAKQTVWNQPDFPRRRIFLFPSNQRNDGRADGLAGYARRLELDAMAIGIEFSKERAYSQRRVVFAFSFGPFLGFWTAYDALETGLPLHSRRRARRMACIRSSSTRSNICSGHRLMPCGCRKRPQASTRGHALRSIIGQETGGSDPSFEGFEA